MDSLVSTGWLAERLDDPDLVVLDCTVQVIQGPDGTMRSESGRPDYDAGHIPGAGFADLLGDLADTASPYDNALPSPEEFCGAMGALGVGDDSKVVLYDGLMSVWAARVWWMLRWVGFDRAAVLDGGITAWELEERPLSTDPPSRGPAVLTPRPRPELVADRHEVLAAIDDRAVSLVDTLPPEHYRGDWALYARAGHIPGAANVPAQHLLDDSGRFLPEEELRRVVGEDPGGRVITYCGGGIAASANAFVMNRLGFDDVAVYIASLQEWAADPGNPMVVGDRT